MPFYRGQPVRPPVTCPICGAKNSAPVGACWKCGVPAQWGK